MALTPLRIGIAGYGGFGRFLRESWGVLEGVNVVAVASLEDVNDLRAYKQWESLITDKEVDLVAVATPPNLHATAAIAMLEAGKDVIIEKPIATTLEDARRLIEVRDRTKRVATVDFMMRFTPFVEALERWKQEQPFGRLRHAVIENHARDDTLNAAHWFWNPVESGGILVEHGVHFFDLIASLTDAHPVRVQGWSHRRPEGLEDRMSATVYYDDGFTASQYHTFSRPGFFEHTTLRLWFDLAEMEFEGWFPLSGKIHALTNAASEGALSMLPHFTETARRQISNVDRGPLRQIRISGEPFEVANEIEGTFDVRRPKAEIYADAVRGVLQDVRQAISDPEHHLRVPLEAGYEALRLALEATHDAHAHA